jgi:fructose 1,6-bisphosphate aldolase/phosphatase
MFTADKTDPGAYSLPLYLTFADPMNTPGLLLTSKMNKGFKFVIMDANHTQADRIIELYSPENIYDIAALLRDQQRFVIESVWTRDGKQQIVSVSTTRLHNVAGKYVGKDDPVMLARSQKDFPATGEFLCPYAYHHYVGGGMRGSHNVPLMPVEKNSSISFFDGPPVVGCLAFCVQKGKLTEPADVFDHPFWDYVRDKASQDAIDMRRQGFFGPAMLPYSELEYGGITEILKRLERKFVIRRKPKPKR